MDQILDASVEILKQYGLAGAVIGYLAYYVLMQRADLKDTRASHGVEIAAKDKRIMDLEQSRLEEVKVGFEIARQNQMTLAALTNALQGQRRDR